MDRYVKERMSSLPLIPIENIYYLLCYAWDRLEQSDVVDVSSLSCQAPVDPFASVLLRGIEHLQRRDFLTGYKPDHAEIPGVRGRIDILGTERRLLLRQGRTACDFDELSIDSLANRIIKSTLRLLASDPDLGSQQRSKIFAAVTQTCFDI
jgi:5-methylcytosine-specific restriction enzyme subunit McrC